MAKKDITRRYLQVEQEYLEMSELLKELKDDLAAGKIDPEWYQERAAMISEEVEKVKTQYFFWAEAIFELKKPARKDRKVSKADQEWYNTFQSIAKDAILDESADVLKQLKQLIKEGQIK